MSEHMTSTKGGRDPAPKKQIRSIWIGDDDDAVILLAGKRNRSLGVRELVRFYREHAGAQGGDG